VRARKEAAAAERELAHARGAFACNLYGASSKQGFRGFIQN